jgi:hypothetical protein
MYLFFWVWVNTNLGLTDLFTEKKTALVAKQGLGGP